MFWCRHFLLWISATFSLSKIQDTRYKNERKLRVNSGRLLKERRVEWPITVFPFFPFVSRFLIFKASFVKKSRTINYKNKLFTRKNKKEKQVFFSPKQTTSSVLSLRRKLLYSTDLYTSTKNQVTHQSPSEPYKKKRISSNMKRSKLSG